MSQVFDLWNSLLRFPSDGDDIKSGSVVMESALVNEGLGGSGKAALFFRGDGFGGSSREFITSGFYFYENQPIPVDGDQVDLAKGVAELPGDDGETKPPEVARCGAFSGVSQKSVPPAQHIHIP